MAIKEVLAFLGIGCTLRNGHVCMMRVSIVNEQPEFGWAGFWDRDDHAWAFTEFGELIDLTISHLHQHSASASRVDLPIPAIWWDDITRWPPTMMYMPGGNPIADFSPEETQSTERFMEKLREKVKAKGAEKLGPRYEEAILSGLESLNALTEQKHPWVLFSSYGQHVAMPPWVLNRLEVMRREVKTQNPSEKPIQKKKSAPTKKGQPKKRKRR